MTADAPRPAPRPTRFLLLYALANAGGTVAFLPLLTLLLPLKVEEIAGAGRLGLLSATAVFGALAASLSNILFGWLSDRGVAAGATRRPWIWAGLVLTAATYAGVYQARSPVALAISVVAFQVAVNAILAPLWTMMADAVPDEHKGVAGGLLAIANPLASAVSALLVASMLGEGARFAIVCLVFSALIAPLLLMAPPLRLTGSQAGEAERPLGRTDLAFAWGSRLLVQVAGNVLFLFALFYFESVAPQIGGAVIAPRVGSLFAAVFALSAPLAILVGRASDRVGARKPFLLASGGAMAAGLVTMATVPGWNVAAAGFALFAVGNAVFTSLHAALAMQLLPSAGHRGRDLGLLNLTNTLPSLIGPCLAWLLATPASFSLLLLVLAALAMGGALLILPIRSQR